MEDGVIQDRVARENGARVLVIDARKSDVFDEQDGGRWITWCDRHETFVQHETKAIALSMAPGPTVWCGLCAEGLE